MATFAFEVEGQKTTALLYRAPNAHATLVLAHGAGAPQTHPWMVKVAKAISARGLDVVTFNFLYSEARRRVPDRPAVLEATWRAAMRATVAQPGVSAGRLFIGGKSMGGRMATQVAAGEAPDIAGLVLLGYPLHPPGKPKELRVAHLGQVRAPMLFVQGSRDPFGSPEELGPVVAGLARGTRLYIIEGGDHSLAPPKSGAERIDDVIARVADQVAAFTG